MGQIHEQRLDGMRIIGIHCFECQGEIEGVREWSKSKVELVMDITKTYKCPWCESENVALQMLPSPDNGEWV